MSRLMNRRLFRFTIVTALILGTFALSGTTAAAPSPSASYVLYGVNSADDGLSIIDPDTGAVNYIDALHFDMHIYVTPCSMAVHPTTHELYVWNNSDLRQLSPPIKKQTGELLKVDKITGRATQITATNQEIIMGALAFTPDGTLCGFGQGTYSGLYHININTGIPTLIRAYVPSSSFYAADTGADGYIYAIKHYSFLWKISFYTIMTHL